MSIRPSSNSPEVRVAPSRDFKPGIGSKAELFKESIELLNDPGDKLNLMSGHKFREVRSKLEMPTPYTGVHFHYDEKPTATDVPNPNRPDGRWNPTDFMPRFVFDAAEDALPVAPDFDGDADLDNNIAEGHYKDGVVGGQQPLSGGFTVTKKGEYTILTYSFYYAHNKAGDFHQNDYSTAQVYLKPGPDGKLAPTHLMTSWHHGAVLTKWEDLPKDPQGRPIVGVNLGSHSLEVRDKVPTKGMQILGDGSATLDGKPIGQSITFDAFQKNIDNARYLDPTKPEAAPRLNAMRWGETAMEPFLPEVFEAAPPALWQMLSRVGSAIGSGVEKAVDKVKDGVGKAVDKAKDLFSHL